MEKVNIGKENATFQQICALKENRNKRASLGLFFVEGIQNIKDALAFNWQIEAFIYSSETKLSQWAKSVIGRANKNYILSQPLMEKLSDKEATSELLALIKMKDQQAILTDDNPVYLLLDRPSKKGNLGTIIRSCDAFGVTQIFYSGHAVDIYDHAVVTASMGSFFKMQKSFIESNTAFLELVEKLKKLYKDFQVVGTSLQTDELIGECDFTKPTLLLIGNETDGLCRFYNENADKLVKIQMREGIDSLNIACAATASLYEIQRQRMII